MYLVVIIFFHIFAPSLCAGLSKQLPFFVKNVYFKIFLYNQSSLLFFYQLWKTLPAGKDTTKPYEENQSVNWAHKEIT